MKMQIVLLVVLLLNLVLVVKAGYYQRQINHAVMATLADHQRELTFQQMELVGCGCIKRTARK